MKQKILITLCLFISLGASAESEFPNILFLKEGQESPSANLSVVKWMQGHWRGEAFGGIVEETWAPALGDSMMGAFKLVVAGKVQFYEIETISEEGGSLVFRLRHFHSDLKAWEEKHVTLDFKLVKVMDGKVFFDGLTLERINDDKINIYVAIDEKGKVTEHKFSYQKVN